MDDTSGIVLSLLFAVVALVYASVGQAGATGYLAAMGLFGMAPSTMKVTALALNLMVSFIGVVQVWRAARLDLWRILPFLATGVPFSALGGSLDLPIWLFFPVVGGILLLAALQMARGAFCVQSAGLVCEKRQVHVFPALLAGASVGLVSGLTGTGGGVFLAPVLLTLRWGNAREVAAATVVFNLLISVSALLGAHSLRVALPDQMPVWLISAAIGGYIGAALGTRNLPERWMRGVLALLLGLSGVKLLFSG